MQEVEEEVLFMLKGWGGQQSRRANAAARLCLGALA